LILWIATLFCSGGGPPTPVVTVANELFRNFDKKENKNLDFKEAVEHFY
jgi:hypothetical protein